MKRYIAIFLVLAVVILTFTACEKTVIVDENGVEHIPVMKNGEFVQDKYGNLLEKVENEEGKKENQPFAFPEVYIKDKNTIENRFFIIDVPSDWKYDENLKICRIQHDSKCAEEGKAMCELSFEESSTGDVDTIFKNAYAIELKLQLMQPEFVTDVKTFETKIFGKDAMAYSCRYSSGSTIYYYAFEQAGAAVGVKLIVGDECADKISAEEFLAENLTLKKLG